MALDRHSADIGESANHLFAAAYSGDASTPRAGVYRCRCCGEEITFDSLSADCSCSEECYQEGPVATH
jgi:hypothetical protein